MPPMSAGTREVTRNGTPMSAPRVRLALVASLLLATALAAPLAGGGGAATPGWAPAAPEGAALAARRRRHPVLLAAGDIASCASDGDEATAALLDGRRGTVAALGDLAYDAGTAAEFRDC